MKHPSSRIPNSLIRLINVLLVLGPFLACWYGYYEPLTLTAGSKQVSALMIGLYCLLFFYQSRKLDGFHISIMRISDIAISQTLAAAVTDVIAYILIWMLSIWRPKLLPGLAAFAAQTVLIVIFSLLVHRWYFKTHKPLKTIVVFDVRQGMEKLIYAYGLEKRFNVIMALPVEHALDDPEMLMNVDAVFLCGVHTGERNKLLKFCIANDIKLYLIPHVGDMLLDSAERIHMLHLPMLRCQRAHPNTSYRVIKRAIDIVLSSLGLIVASPIMLVTALMVRSDGGPAFYKQVRLTKDGKEFSILKFRSMHVDAEKYSGAVVSTGESDPRITRVGRVIRACRIDELPQLINILRGDMSLVGPRPERPEIAEKYEQELPEFSLRLQVKAGLTGYAQVYGKYNTTPYDKLLMDLMYIAKPSILEDISIMLATVKILFSKESTEGYGEQAVEMKYENRDRDVPS